MKLLTLPGLIDPHVHLRDLGLEYKEDFYSGTSAALAGGYTTVIDMPNNKNPIFTKEALEEKIKIAKEKIVCNTGFYFGTDGKNLKEFEKVKNMAMGLKIYMNETTGNFLIDWQDLENIFKAWPEDAGPILLHAEKEAVIFALKVVKKIKRKTHFCHINLKNDLVQILKTKEKGLPITCGVTPHHLFLSLDDLPKLKGLGIMKPPLATQKDVDFLWKQIKNIDIIESDHAPHAIEEKQKEKPAYGIPGLETTLPLLLTAVSEGKITIEDIKRLCFTNPKQLFSSIHAHWTFHNKVIVDLDEEWIIENKNLKTKCGWSPFNGRKVKGKVKEVYLHKELVFKDGKIVNKKGTGQIVQRNVSNT
ncbi:MAG: amidohydrolase family protein [Actinobacteria bacterium]|nr:amidohydrolase family protein [Actinomycetota bacterium]